MMLSSILPEKQFGLDDVIHMSGSKKGKSVWPAKMLVEMRKLGIDVVMIEGFNARRFVAEGADYLRDEFAGETAEWQIANSDIPKEQRNYVELLASGVKIEKRIPTTSDICSLLDAGWLVKCTVNSRRLKKLDGYVGHSVVVLSVDKDEIILHNPGLPPEPFQHVSIADFEAAWAYPNEAAKELIAARK